jgi:hypothetical protein
LAQLRAGKSSKSKLLIAKFKSAKSLKGWEVRQGSYFPNTFVSRFDEGIDASLDFSEDQQAVFSGSTFSFVAFMTWFPFLNKIKLKKLYTSCTSVLLLFECHRFLMELPYFQDLYSQEVDMLRYQKGFLFL